MEEKKNFDYAAARADMARDEYTKTFSNEAEASDFFAKLNLNDLWLEMQSNTLKFALIDEQPLPLNWADKTQADKAIKDLDLKGCTSDSVLDSMRQEGTWGYIEFAGKGRYLCRSNAIDGLKYRAGQEGRATDNMYNKRRGDYYVRQINEGLDIMNTTVQALYRGEKITALNSKDYAILPISELLVELEGALEERFEDAIFDGGFYSHNITELCWNLPAQSAGLLDAYRKSLDDSGNETANFISFMPAISFRTSDAGINCATVRARLTGYTVGGKKIDIDLGDAVRIEHRKPATIQKFADACKMLFAAYINQTDKLADLLKIEIDDEPGYAMSGMVKAVSLPPNVYKKACEEFEQMGDKPTAHDVFWAICRGANAYIDERNLSGEKKIRIEECIARILCYSKQDWIDIQDKARANAAKILSEKEAS